MNPQIQSIPKVYHFFWDPPPPLGEHCLLNLTLLDNIPVLLVRQFPIPIHISFLGKKYTDYNNCKYNTSIRNKQIVNIANIGVWQWLATLKPMVILTLEMK